MHFHLRKYSRKVSKMHKSHPKVVSEDVNNPVNIVSGLHCCGKV